MDYMVKKGDTLWDIARIKLNDPRRWNEIARINQIPAPYLIIVNQTLQLPETAQKQPLMQGGPRMPGPARSIANASEKPSEAGAGNVPGRGFLFVLADEVLPSGKLVRKVLHVPTNLAEQVKASPDVFGFKANNKNSLVTIGEHALGDTNSKFTSASTKPGGAPNISGKPYYIDIKKAKAAGVTIHSTTEIVQDLDKLAAADPSLKARVEKLKNAIQHVEGEVLMEGDVPASAVKGKGAMAVTRTLRFVAVVGAVATVYDISKATVKSVEQESPKPIAAEGIRQLGGWGSGWVGMKLGCAAGAAVGIETGPGAIVTCGIGGLIFGVAGYYGFDWIADHIDEN